jgi:hypothetical protein
MADPSLRRHACISREGDCSSPQLRILIDQPRPGTVALPSCFRFRCWPPLSCHAPKEGCRGAGVCLHLVPCCRLFAPASCRGNAPVEIVSRSSQGATAAALCRPESDDGEGRGNLKKLAECERRERVHGNSLRAQARVPARRSCANSAVRSGCQQQRRRGGGGGGRCGKRWNPEGDDRQHAEASSGTVREPDTSAALPSRMAPACSPLCVPLRVPRL